jgi:putative flippase GtrA
MLRSILVFSKAQISSFIGGVVDYGVMIALTELLHIHYTISIVFGGIVGAAVNFSVNRVWGFYSKETPYRYSVFQQLIMFCPMVFGSIALKSGGTFLLTSLTKIDYKFTKLAVDALVSVFFNFMLQKHWIFKKRR